MRVYAAIVPPTLLLSLILLAGPAAIAQDAEERFTATAVSLAGPRSSTEVTPVDLTIRRWSTSQENQQLIATLRVKGSEAMVDTLREMKPVGSIQLPGSVAYELRYAYQEPLPDGGRRIVLATDRPMSHWEIANQPRSAQYPFTFIELRLNAKGEGAGKIALATKIDVSANGQLIELVNYAAEPVRLNNVERQARS